MKFFDAARYVAINFLEGPRGMRRLSQARRAYRDAALDFSVVAFANGQIPVLNLSESREHQALTRSGRMLDNAEQRMRSAGRNAQYSDEQVDGDVEARIAGGRNRGAKHGVGSELAPQNL